MFNRMKRVVLTIMVFAITPCGILAENIQDKLESDNAAYWYQMAYDQYEKPKAFDIGEYADWEIELTTEIETFLMEHEYVVEFIMKGSRKKSCNWGYDEFENVWFNTPSHASAIEVKAICGLLLADARLKASQNLHEAVLRRWESLFRYSSHIDGTQSLCHLIAVAITHSVYDNIHKYVNQHPNMPIERLKAIIRLLHKEQELKHHSLKEVFEYFDVFAKAALTEHKEQARAGLLDGSSVEKILNINEKGWLDEFCERNLKFCLAINKRSQEALELPYPESWVAIKNIELKLGNAEFEKYTQLPDDYVPTQDDYEDFMKQSEYLFYGVSGPMASMQFYAELKGKTDANALRTALPILLDYRKANHIPESLPADGPKDLFSDKVFVIQKTNSGFKLVCRGRDLRKSKRHEYVFELPKAAVIEH